MREVQGGKVRRNAQLYKLLTQNIRVGCLVWYFDPRIIPWTSHKLRLFWAGPYQVSKLIAPSLAEIKPVYYHGEENLVCLEVLKLYRGEDVVPQEPADVDPDPWMDEGELTKLPYIPVGDRDRVLRETCMDSVNPEVISVPDLEVPMIFKGPEEMAMREGIQERIQAEIYHEDRERAFQAKEMLDTPL